MGPVKRSLPWVERWAGRWVWQSDRYEARAVDILPGADPSQNLRLDRVPAIRTDFRRDTRESQEISCGVNGANPEKVACSTVYTRFGPLSDGQYSRVETGARNRHEYKFLPE